MHTSTRGYRYAAMALIAALALSACKTQQVQTREDNLSAAGFLVVPANTPEKKAMLNRLPANRFVMRTHGNVVHYVYADPLVCGCLYVGTQQQYNQYVRDRQTQDQLDEQQMTAQMYQDPAWDWNPWGPWPPAYGFYYEGGW